jgi:hypothetical protein
MSVNDTMAQYKRQQDFNNNLDNFKTGDLQVLWAHNETINSSNLVMNNMDRANVKDFILSQVIPVRDSQHFISDMFVTNELNNETFEN